MSQVPLSLDPPSWPGKTTKPPWEKVETWKSSTVKERSDSLRRTGGRNIDSGAGATQEENQFFRQMKNRSYGVETASPGTQGSSGSTGHRCACPTPGGKVGKEEEKAMNGLQVKLNIKYCLIE